MAEMAIDVVLQRCVLLHRSLQSCIGSASCCRVDHGPDVQLEVSLFDSFHVLFQLFVVTIDVLPFGYKLALQLLTEFHHDGFFPTRNFCLDQAASNLLDSEQ